MGHYQSFSNSFSNKFEDYRKKIDKAILSRLESRKDSQYFTILKKTFKGGKRSRPILLLLSYEAVDNSKKDPLPAAIIVEMLHAESLIQDDIIDEDFQRRGETALHFSFGKKAALLSADLILSLILEITSKYKNPKIERIISETTSKMVEGELRELFVHESESKIDIQDYLEIISQKTAPLFETSALLGAIIGGAKQKEEKILANFGKKLGIAYQIRDDISDSEKQAKINILDQLDTSFEKKELLNKLYKDKIKEAKNKLSELEKNKAVKLLFDFIDFARPH
ncbi:hypothetical protein AKJ51_01875 [candidate division MSBL1 archaeon SCGC-AAA382A20]|uniref:Geranylgeranyl pyrophosphate synthase n=1 Tax=candidate division MSBL1 archaeon SCGC-AAA382A20 TaxID=1698280 RepID=A0A133VL62_9EURY|nr:hypothetical protein AKJ51_01875 [candidate division MSBL1 archaeon SCGC-AAA382A20]